MERYVKLSDVEKAIIKRVDWDSNNLNPIEIRNDILEVLEMLDFIYFESEEELIFI